VPGRYGFFLDVCEVAPLNLEAGCGNPGTSSEPVAVLASGGPDVELVPQLTDLDIERAERLDEEHRGIPRLRGVPRLESLVDVLDEVYCGKMRLRSFGWMMPSFRRNGSV